MCNCRGPWYQSRLSFERSVYLSLPITCRYVQKYREISRGNCTCGGGWYREQGLLWWTGGGRLPVSWNPHLLILRSTHRVMRINKKHPKWALKLKKTSQVRSIQSPPRYKKVSEIFKNVWELGNFYLPEIGTFGCSKILNSRFCFEFSSAHQFVRQKNSLHQASGNHLKTSWEKVLRINRIILT